MMNRVANDKINENKKSKRCRVHTIGVVSEKKHGVKLFKYLFVHNNYIWIDCICIVPKNIAPLFERGGIVTKKEGWR